MGNESKCLETSWVSWRRLEDVLEISKTSWVSWDVSRHFVSKVSWDVLKTSWNMQGVLRRLKTSWRHIYSKVSQDTFTIFQDVLGYTCLEDVFKTLFPKHVLRRLQDTFSKMCPEKSSRHFFMDILLDMDISWYSQQNTV